VVCLINSNNDISAVPWDTRKVITPHLQKLLIELKWFASLQYGTQFGGLLNFALNDGDGTEAFEITSRQSIGSFNLFNSFNSIGGKKR
jgi:hypothetical protein